MRKPCRHCRNPKATRPRGLCWTCYQSPAIRAAYPSTSPLGRRSPVRDECDAVLPTEPTDALPATEAKVVVMGERALMGCGLFHPLDAPGDLS